MFYACSGFLFGNYTAIFRSVGILPAFERIHARIKFLTSTTIQAMRPLETQAGSLSSNKAELLPFLYNNLLQKHTTQAAIQGIWINPDSTQAVDTDEQIVPPFPLPALYIMFGSVQVISEGFTAFPAA
jgi:hypothetical protein